MNSVEEIKSESFRINSIDSKPFEINCVNRSNAFDFYYNQLESVILKWIEEIDEDQQIKNMKSSKDYALIHFIAKKIFPTSYADDVGVFLVDEEMVKDRGMSIEDFLEREENKFSFENFYSETTMSLIDTDMNMEITKLIDTKKLMAEYAVTPIDEHQDILEKWSEIYLVELVTIAETILIAASRVISKNVLANCENRLECN